MGRRLRNRRIIRATYRALGDKYGVTDINDETKKEIDKRHNEYKKQKEKEDLALKDPLANSVNRGEVLKEPLEQNEDVSVGLNDVNVDFQNKLEQNNKKDKLKRMLSL